MDVVLPVPGGPAKIKLGRFPDSAILCKLAISLLLPTI
jgi:hypothetical protein